MQRSIRHGQPELWIKALFAVVAVGLCLSAVVSYSLFKMVKTGMSAELEMPSHAVAAKRPNVTSLTTQQINEITGHADVLNKILLNGMTMSAARSERNGIGYFQQPGGTL